MTEMEPIDAEIVAEPTLFDLAAEANHWHSEALTHATSAIQAAWYAGQALNKANEQFRYRRDGDGFVQWLKDNFAGPQAYAYRYMKIAKFITLDKLSAHKTLTGALKSLERVNDRREREQEREREQAEQAELSGLTPVDLRHGDFRQVLADLSNIDAIITDPPYPYEFIELFTDLSTVAADILKPGGLCAVMAGQSYLPEIFNRLSYSLTYRWTLAYLTPGGQAVQAWDRNINTFWKPILLFTNGRPEQSDWIGDVASSTVNDNDKQHHHWGQSESGMADLIGRLTKPDQLICDPFLGGGTTAVISHDLGRRFIGCDIDQSCLNTTRRRFNQ